jgi:hypothetical protein
MRHWLQLSLQKMYFASAAKCKLNRPETQRTLRKLNPHSAAPQPRALFHTGDEASSVISTEAAPTPALCYRKNILLSIFTGAWRPIQEVKHAGVLG